jgi:hypothetical protein
MRSSFPVNRMCTANIGLSPGGLVHPRIAADITQIAQRSGSELMTPLPMLLAPWHRPAGQAALRAEATCPRLKRCLIR